MDLRSRAPCGHAGVKVGLKSISDRRWIVDKYGSYYLMNFSCHRIIDI